MRPKPFALERYFARHESSARHLLSCSDCEPLTLTELLGMTDDETRELWEHLSLAYTDSAGLPQLRREIASMYTGIGEEDVLEVVPEEGIFLGMHALLQPGDHVIVQAPAYQSLYALAEDIGCEVTRWLPDEAAGWHFDPAFVRGALRPNTRLVVCDFPHNPTGAMLSADEFEQLLGIVGAVGVHLFSDEMYRCLEQDPATRLPSAAERYDRAVSLSGMSKTFALPGLRVGWLVTHDRELRSRLGELKDYTTICASAPSEVLALVGLRARDRILERNLGIIRGNIAAMDRFMAKHRGMFAWTPPRAGSVALARVRAPRGTWDLCERLAAEAEVMLVPSALFDFGDAHVRFGLGRAAFGAGLSALDRWIAFADPNPRTASPEIPTPEEST
jgi:aspartate/methionine/tyrosine aminotransferase